MKAAVYYKYGSPEELKIEELEKPVPKDDEVLVKVFAASINSWDWDLLIGKPYLYRLLFGLLKPRHRIIGSDVAGVVEAIGNKVTSFKPGDEVMGDLSPQGFGTFSEYVCAREELLTSKPPGMNFSEASAIPQAGVLALQALHYNGHPKAGQHILVNGAGGGVGTIAVQLAKSSGAVVTAIDKVQKHNMLRKLGADHVIDYLKENFTKGPVQYDRIIDVIARHSIFDYKRVLKNRGTYCMVGGSISSLLQAGFLGPVISGRSGKKIGILAHKANRKDLERLNELFVSGKFKPVIDKIYPLEEIAEAHRYFGEGHVKGKVVINMQQG